MFPESEIAKVLSIITLILATISLVLSVILHNTISYLISTLIAGMTIGILTSVAVIQYISERNFKEFWEPIIKRYEEKNKDVE